MAKYAEGTTVSVEKSQSEIRKILTAHKATSFGVAEDSTKAVVSFNMNKRFIRLTFPLPVYMKARDKKNYLMSHKQIEQETKRLWRCMVLVIKSKLECVASGITTFDTEFLAHIVLPEGGTTGDYMIPLIAEAYDSGKMPAQLNGQPLIGYNK